MSALGKITESCTPPDYARADYRAERYRMQRKTWELLPNRGRLTACCNALNTGPGDKGYATIRKVTEFTGEYCTFQGVMRCGSLWTCPICAPIVAKRRAKEIAHAIDQAHQKGQKVLFVTFTFRHQRNETLQDNLKAMSTARAKFWAGNPATRLKTRFGIVGRITATEVTHGEENGWHPHIHELIFVDQYADETELSNVFFDRWSAIATKCGLGTPIRERGVTVRHVCDSVEAISKYAVFGSELASTELTSAHTKQGRKGGRTPWELLRDATNGDKRSAWLWKEFAEAFYGRATVYWSKGLKDLYSIEELSDEDHLNGEDQELEQHQEVIKLYKFDLYLLRKYKARNGALQIAELLGERGVRAFLNQLLELDRAEREAYRKRLAAQFRNVQTRELIPTSALPRHALRMPALGRHSKTRSNQYVN